MDDDDDEERATCGGADGAADVAVLRGLGR